MNDNDGTAAPARGIRLPVVGIGASAGGLHALQTFFRALPSDTGAAYVVIVHLDPEHQSELARILGMCTAMPVAEVKDREAIAANHVYVISPNRRLLIAEDEISTAPFDEPRGLRMPIDQFFRSLAEQHGDGFAIILTGAGTDGANGVKAIKEHGGLILVQDPREASILPCHARPSPAALPISCFPSTSLRRAWATSCARSSSCRPSSWQAATRRPCARS